MSKAVLEDGVIAGNHYDKYNSKNPISRHLLNQFHAAFDELVEATSAKDVHEVGCGEGSMSIRLATGTRRVRGSDFSTGIIAKARDAATVANSPVQFEVRSIYALDPALDAAELVIACEVLEHLEHPEKALAVLVRLAQPYLLVSVPNEPLWRILNMCRGKYWRNLGNTPGHLQHWSRASFLRMLRKHLTVVEVRTPLPWSIALCRAPEPRSAVRPP